MSYIKVIILVCKISNMPTALWLDRYPRRTFTYCRPQRTIWTIWSLCGYATLTYRREVRRRRQRHRSLEILWNNKNSARRASSHPTRRARRALLPFPGGAEGRDGEDSSNPRVNLTHHDVTLFRRLSAICERENTEENDRSNDSSSKTESSGYRNLTMIQD